MAKLKLKEKVAYGAGDFGNGFMFDLGQAYLLKFYTDICGISGIAAGGVFLFTKIFDAFMDPIAGSWIDKRKASRNGKFKPVMFFSSIILAILTVVTFLTPDTSVQGKLIFAYATYMAWGVLYSFTNVPYGSLGASMTQNVQERTQLASFRQAGSLSALLITGVAFMPLVSLFSSERVGYPVVAGIMSLVGVLAFFFTYRVTKEVVPIHEQGKITTKDLIRTITSNKPLLVLILMTVFSISAYNIKTAMLIYFCQYNLGDVRLMAYINFVIIGCSVIGISILPWLVKVFGKKKAAILGFSISVIADIINFMLPANPVTFTILASIAFVGISIPNGITWAFVSDVIDYGEWKTGKRNAATTYAAFNFSRKIAQSLSGFASGIGLTLVGYIPHIQQSTTALLGIKGLLMLYPAIALSIAACILGLLYFLNDREYNQIVEELQQRQLANQSEIAANN